MTTPLERVSGLEYLIRQLTKLDSKLEAGHVIQAWRENRRIIAELERAKQELIQKESKKDEE